MVEELPTADRSAVLAHLHNQGWLYLYDGRGNGRAGRQLPTSLLGLDDDPYRSLVWKLKQEVDQASALIPYQSFVGVPGCAAGPCPLQLQAPGAGTRSSPPAGVLTRCTGHAGLER